MGSQIENQRKIRFRSEEKASKKEKEKERRESRRRETVMPNEISITLND